MFVSKVNHQYHSNPSLCPATNAEEAEVKCFYEDLQDLLELTPKKDIIFIIGDCNTKVGSQEIPGSEVNSLSRVQLFETPWTVGTS